MDEVTKEITTASVLYDITEIMNEHNLTADQALYLMCSIQNIEYDISLSDIGSLSNKGLIISKKINSKLLFHLKSPKQLSLNLNPASVPNGSKFTLNIADRIEKAFVIDKFNTEKERKRFADKFFKGDISVARYYIIFKALFPVKSKHTNAKWNTKFGIIYDGGGLWDGDTRVAKKFHDIYRRLDIGVFLEATYTKVKDSIDFEQEKCFMTKPYKFLTGFDHYYQETLEEVFKREQKSKTKVSTITDINKLRI